MIKLTITQIGTPKDKQTKYGVKQTNYIKSSEYGDKFLNYWVSHSTKDWAVGKTIEVDAVEESKWTGQDGTERTSLNIKLPKAFNGNPEVQKALEEIRGQNTKILLMLTEIGKAVIPQPTDHYKELGIPEEVTPPNFEPTVNIGDERATPNDEFAGLDDIAQTL